MSKSIAKNSIYNMIYRGFNALFPLITTSYISRILLAEGVGKVEYARTVVTYFTTIAALGIPNYGIRIIAQDGERIENRSKSFWELFVINAISTTICVVAYYFLVNTAEHFATRRLLFNVAGSLLLLNYFNIDWFYQGIEEYGYITKRSIIIKLVSMILMLFFVKTENDYVIYMAILCLASAGNYIFNMFHLKRYIGKPIISSREIREHVKPVLILMGSTIATEIYTMLDTVMLEYFQGEVYVGYYHNCIKIVRMIYTMSIAMVAAYYPRISLHLKDSIDGSANKLLTQGAKVLMLLSIPATVGVFMTSEVLVPVLLGNSFMPSVGALRILSVLICIFSFAYFLGHIVLMATGQENHIFIASICGAIVNASLNYFLIPQFQHYGAALASVIAEIVVTSILIGKARHSYKLCIAKGYSFSIIVANTVMIFLVALVNSTLLPNIHKLILSIVGGGLVYFIVLYMLKNEIVLSVLRRIKTNRKRG